jgi:hypothetical protein
MLGRRISNVHQSSIGVQCVPALFCQILNKTLCTGADEVIYLDDYLLVDSLEDNLKLRLFALKGNLETNNKMKRNKKRRPRKQNKFWQSSVWQSLEDIHKNGMKIELTQRI